MNIDISCQCGSLNGTVEDVSPKTGTNVICYCRDCQAFAAVLDRIDDLLDDRGGTPIFQTSPFRLKIRECARHLSALTLSGRGVVRWYTSCCNTPIGNTMNTPGLSFVGLTGLNRLATQPDQATLAMGPSRGAVNPQGAWRSGVEKKVSLPSILLRFFSRVLGVKLSGRTYDTPFFDREGKPVSNPRRVSDEERAAADMKLSEYREQAQ